MPIIYQPSGMAREYSPYACNLYIGCSHKCKYCYAPRALQRTAESFFGVTTPRKNVLKHLERELQTNIYKEQIMLSFIGDVYGESTDDNQTTRDVLQLLNTYNAPVAILSKGGNKMLRDSDVFAQFGSNIMVGTTLTLLDEAKSLEWEYGAAAPSERLEVLQKIKSDGVKTFASFEPVIDPQESIRLIEKTLSDNSVDQYKIGKINNYRGYGDDFDWSAFLTMALDMLRPAGKEVYIKKSLRSAAPDVVLRPEEMDADLYCVRVE